MGQTSNRDAGRREHTPNIPPDHPTPEIPPPKQYNAHGSGHISDRRPTNTRTYNRRRSPDPNISISRSLSEPDMTTTRPTRHTSTPTGPADIDLGTRRRPDERTRTEEQNPDIPTGPRAVTPRTRPTRRPSTTPNRLRKTRTPDQRHRPIRRATDTPPTRRPPPDRTPGATDPDDRTPDPTPPPTTPRHIPTTRQSTYDRDRPDRTTADRRTDTPADPTQNPTPTSRT
ncbi:hypothetical protein NHX12_014638 [Muraenolepis orangiensis]|uniref:Uncharacterized protein n=1 Tax=Muraenolepis orangiensis TaxID=630683 RepID=A0A9Q0I2A3_9TELE|nr:hypothetical protein NHX12_014638 [Muraenolepis orangiensis]